MKKVLITVLLIIVPLGIFLMTLGKNKGPSLVKKVISFTSNEHAIKPPRKINPPQKPTFTLPPRTQNKSHSFAEIKAQLLDKYPQGDFKLTPDFNGMYKDFVPVNTQKYDHLSLDEKAMAFLKDHPELLSDLPEGVDIVIEDIKDNPAGSAVIIQPQYNGIPFPGNQVMTVSKSGKILRLQNNLLSLKTIRTCENVSSDQAVQKVIDYHGKEITLSHSPQKVYRPNSNQEALMAWEINYQFEQDSQYKNYLAYVDGCEGELLGAPQKVQIDEDVFH